MNSRLLMTRTYILPVGLFFIFTGSLDIVASICTKWVLDHDSENNTDSSIVLWEKNDSQLIDCALFCGMDSSCRSYFHHPSLKTCLGSQSYKRALPKNQTAQQGWNYYTHPQNCDLDYIYNDTLGLCYKLYETPKTYYDAMESCEKEGAKLLSIRNETELLQVCQLMSGNFSGIWIGLKKTDVNPVWKWWNGQEDSMTMWNAGHPVPYNGTALCGQIPDWSNECGYVSYDCTYTGYFICQKNI